MRKQSAIRNNNYRGCSRERATMRESCITKSTKTAQVLDNKKLHARLSASIVRGWAITRVTVTIAPAVALVKDKLAWTTE